MATLVTSLNTGVTALVKDLISVISVNAPVLLTVFGALIAVGIVIKVVRRVTGH